jgi:hypothetical protein
MYAGVDFCELLSSLRRGRRAKCNSKPYFAENDERRRRPRCAATSGLVAALVNSSVIEVPKFHGTKSGSLAYIGGRWMRALAFSDFATERRPMTRVFLYNKLTSIQRTITLKERAAYY